MATQQSILYSTDDVTWQSTPTPADSTTSQGYSVRWADFVTPAAVHEQKFVAIVKNAGGASATIVTSVDGITWVATGLAGLAQFNALIGVIKDGSTVPSGSFGALFDSGSGASNGLRGANDFTSLTPVTDPTFAAGSILTSTAEAVAFGTATWIVCDNNQGFVYISSNLGGAWTTETGAAGTQASVLSVLWDGSTQFVNGSNPQAGAANALFSTSPTGVTWTTQLTETSVANAFALAYSPTLPLWVAAGAISPGPVIHLFTSPNGITWTTRANPWPAAPTAICWDSTNSLFVAVFGTNQVSTSPDGLVWTTTTLPFSATNAYEVDHSPTLGVTVITCKYTPPVATGVFVGVLPVGAPTILG